MILTLCWTKKGEKWGKNGQNATSTKEYFLFLPQKILGVKFFMIEKTTSNKDIIFIYQKDKGILCSACVNNPIDIITASSCCIKPRAYVLCDA